MRIKFFSWSEVFGISLYHCYGNGPIVTMDGDYIYFIRLGFNYWALLSLFAWEGILSRRGIKKKKKKKRRKKKKSNVYRSCNLCCVRRLEQWIHYTRPRMCIILIVEIILISPHD